MGCLLQQVKGVVPYSQPSSPQTQYGGNIAVKEYKSKNIRVDRVMFESKAFMALTGIAPQLWITVLGKRRFFQFGRKGKKKWSCTNRDDINITYIEYFNKFGITQPRLTRAIEQLLAKGFITIIHPGGGHRHDKAIYGLSDKYLTWKPGMVIEKREKESVQRGFCKPNRKL